MKNTVDIAFGFLALALVGIVFVLVLTAAEVSDEQAAQDEYCEMVDIWDRSKGEYGWPPYRGRELCN